MTGICPLYFNCNIGVLSALFQKCVTTKDKCGDEARDSRSSDEACRNLRPMNCGVSRPTHCSKPDRESKTLPRHFCSTVSLGVVSLDLQI